MTKSNATVRGVGVDMAKIDYFKHVFVCWQCHKETSRITGSPAPPGLLFCAHCHTTILADHCSYSTYLNPPVLGNESLCMSILFAALLDGTYPDDPEAIDEYIGTTFLIWETLQKELNTYHSGEGESDE